MLFSVADPIAMAAIEEVVEGCQVCSVWDLERLAEAAHQRLEDDATAEALAAAHGLAVAREQDLPRGVPAMRLGDVILSRGHRLRGLATLLILHELAHVLLERSGFTHTHADVWYLTLSLAMPLARWRKMRREAPKLFEDLPAWSIALRSQMPTVQLAA